MLATTALAILVVIVALIYVARQSYDGGWAHWRDNPTQLIYSHITLICFGFGIAALLNSLPGVP